VSNKRAQLAGGPCLTAISQVLQQATCEVQADMIPDEFLPALAALGIETTAGETREILRDGGVARLDWRRLLRQYVGQIMEVRPVFNRPPRRFPDLVGILPGRQRRATKPKILAVLDTSGSITEQLLEQINTELAQLAKRFKVTVVECDEKIRRVYDYRPVKNVCGRLGTDLRPPFAKKFLAKHRPDLVVYFTDGEGPAPDRAPRCPVIWCLTPEGVRPASWGRVVAMDETEGCHLETDDQS
jgi:predicted metal-dependent peptidase